eukprot:TRINITY_DN3296_c0_g1_i4.p2 TRINITY_DN3296_c0_g1~~TRINITY_DN3296_c0_g1_i4.p2  ORF type:complete len:153 (+),score=25.34 TRINITY_DN3296_c0_g1_i4:929-1387(+)
MFLYPGHSILMVQLWDLLGIGAMVPDMGDGLIIELRRRENGEYFVRADFIHPGPGGDTYETRTEPLRCPGFSDSCDFSDFIGFLGNRARLPEPDQGCCYVGSEFFNMGCGDYLNPAVLNIPECVTYRQFCPHVSCDVGQVVDAATLLCVPVA